MHAGTQPASREQLGLQILLRDTSIFSSEEVQTSNLPHPEHELAPDLREAVYINILQLAGKFLQV